MSGRTSAQSTAPQPPVRPAAPTTRRRRAVEAGGFVAVWVAAGYLLPVSTNGYLLLGIPLTIAFQLLVRRRRLHELFAASANRFRLDRSGVAAAVLLAVVPGYFAAQAFADHHWTTGGWYLAGVAGAVCAAFALRTGSARSAVRSAALPVAVGAGGMVLVYGLHHVVSGTPVPAGAAIAALIKYVALYFPVSFLLEEVTFRGALDAHLHHDGETHGWASAGYVSALWGVWHLPVAHAFPWPVQLAELLVVHIMLGVPLSIAWRRSRNLAGPALAHAVNDAVRNALMLGL